MRRILILVSTLVLGIIVAASGQDPKPAPEKKANWREAPKVAAPVAPTAARRDISLREARRMGITVAAVRGHLQAARAAGEIEATTSAAAKSVIVFERVSAANPEQFTGEAAFDIDAILELIETLIALLERFFPS